MCRTWGSNSGPLACQANSLPIELPRPVQHYIQHPNVEHYIRPSKSIFSTRLKNRMLRSIFGSPDLYSALDSKTAYRGLYSSLQVYIKHYIQYLNVELYIRPSSLYSALYSSPECRALDSTLQVYIQHYIQHPNVELYIQHYIEHINIALFVRSSTSIFSTIFDI